MWWIALGAAMLWIDHLTSTTEQFPVIYVLPVILAAWYSGTWPAVCLAIAVPVRLSGWRVRAVKNAFIATLRTSDLDGVGTGLGSSTSPPDLPARAARPGTIRRRA